MSSLSHEQKHQALVQLRSNVYTRKVAALVGTSQSSCNVFARMQFAQRYENWTIDDWKCMLFSDKTKTNRF